MSENVVRRFEPEDSLSSYLANGVPIASPELCIAHLSDLHFVTHPILKRITFRGMVGHDLDALAALETQLLSMEVDLLFVTGDLSTWGDETSLSDARGFVMTLAGKLNLQRSQVFWIPGNHDVIVDYHKIATNTRKFTKICGATSAVEQLNIKGMDLAVFSLAVQAVKSINPNAIKLVQIHHHPLPIPYKKDNGVQGVLTTMTNGATFADRMQETGMHLVMHGHEHFAYSTSMQPYPQEKSTVLVAAGTTCQMQNHEMSFNYLKVRPNTDITLQRYIYRETGFYMDRNSTKVFGS